MSVTCKFVTLQYKHLSQKVQHNFFVSNIFMINHRTAVYKAMQTVDATGMRARRRRVCRRRDYVSVVSRI